jgi:hypothetical protein
MMKFPALAFLVLSSLAATSLAAETTLEQARKQRHDAAHRPRRLVFHSDGVAMNPAHAYQERTIRNGSSSFLA